MERISQRTAVVTVVGSAVATMLLALVLYDEIGQAAAALTFVPVALAGVFFGAGVGAAVGIAVAVLDAAGMSARGVLPGGPEGLGQMLIGAVGFGALGVLGGRMRDLREGLAARTGELERELGQRREYADVLVHELRNPLVAIRAATRMRARDAESLGRAIDAIGQEATRALALLDSLTDASSIESGRMRTVLRTIDLGLVTRRTAERTADPDHPVRFALPDRPLLARGDEERIDQVVRNLLSNAAKYSPPATTIDVTVGVSSDHKNAVVQVRDYGPGIPPGERDRLFGRFTRLSTAGGTPGSGLGLFISRGIARDQGGDLVAEWPAGGGTQFTFTIPLATE